MKCFKCGHELEQQPGTWNHLCWLNKGYNAKNAHIFIHVSDKQIVGYTTYIAHNLKIYTLRSFQNTASYHWSIKIGTSIIEGLDHYSSNPKDLEFNCDQFIMPEIIDDTLRCDLLFDRLMNMKALA